MGWIENHAALIQTLVMLITGIFIIWYTIETFKLRKEMFIQNKLISKQLEKISEQLLIQKKELILKTRPLLKFGPKFGQLRSVTFYIKNEGQDIKNVEIIPINDIALKAVIPGGILKSGQSVKVVIDNIPSDQRYIDLKMKYSTLIDEKEEITIRYDKSSGKINQITPDF